MKYLKEYEGFFSKINKSVSRLFASNVVYRWSEDEMEYLERLGFYQLKNSIRVSPKFGYYFTPSFINTIKEIQVEKYFDFLSESEQETIFYRAWITKKKKPIKKDFDSFKEMIEFVEKYIPEVEKDTKKYNL